jgi:hypothetical protein
MMEATRSQTETKTPYGWIFLVVFAYAAIAAVLVQRVLLPVLFPQWHAGHGLLAGGDWPWFHQVAFDLSERIRSQGWSAWELRPLGQAPAGIAAVFYVLIAPEPWTLIPLHAGLHAVAVVLMVRLIQFLAPDWRVAAIAAVPFALFPSAMTWYTQIHKDGFAIAGFLCIVLGWLFLVQTKVSERLWPRVVLSGGLILVGAGLMWVVRPYAVQLVQASSIFAAATVTFLVMQRARTRKTAWSAALVTVAVGWSAILLMTPFTGGDAKSERLAGSLAEGEGLVQAAPTFVWRRSEWLPAFIETRLRGLALAREGFVTGYPEARSNIDVAVVFRSASDVFTYIPRALQIAFLAPFPKDWAGEGSLPANTVMRRIAGAEMLVLYGGLFLLPYAVVRWRRRPELWIVIVLCSSMMLLYALVVANVGTLYRMRYPYIMTLLAVSLAGGASWWRDHHKRTTALPVLDRGS